MSPDGLHSRRRFLAGAAVGVGGAFAGCNTGSDYSGRTPARTASPPDDGAPRIRSADATPRQDGTVLDVSMRVEDDRELDTARIAYGDREIVRRPDGKRVRIDGRLEGTAAATDDDQQVLYEVTDAAGNEARKQVHPDDTAPELAVTAQPTDDAGEVTVTIQASDDTGLTDVSISLNGEEVLSSDATHSRVFSDERSVAASPIRLGRINTVTGGTVDWNGNTTEKTVESYCRKYDVMDDPRLEIGAVYIPFLSPDNWSRCTGGTPSIGVYDLDDRSAVNRHVDQMQGHGVTKVMFNWSVMEDAGYFSNFTDAILTSDIDVEMFYQISNALKWRGERTIREQLDEHMNYIRDEFLRRENYNTRNGRPTVTFWNVNYLVWGGNETSREIMNGIESDWGSWAAFVDYIRSGLTVDGMEPYLVGDIHSAPMQRMNDRTRALDAQFDAVTNWIGKLRSGATVQWEEELRYKTRSFEATMEFARDNGQDYVPMVMPGFDDRQNECFGDDRHVPRSPDGFRQLLRLADEYRNVNRINIASFNGWPEGHQIEPGSFRGTDYETAYLKVVEQFQRGGSA